MTFSSIMRVAGYLGKGEVVSSILTGSTRFLSSSTTIRNALALIAATFAAMMI